MARSTPSPSSAFSRLTQIACLSMLCVGASAQLLKPIAQQNRVPATPDFSVKRSLAGHVPAWANVNREVPNHPVDQSAAMQVTITLQRDPAVQAAFDQLLLDQQNPGSPMYHHWLTPAEIGQVYGPTQADMDAVVSWLTGQGLTVTNVAPSRMLINAEGTIATVSGAFQTSFAYYTVAGNERRAARSEPVVPQALSPVIAAIGGLAEIFTQPMSHSEPVPNPNRYQTNAPAGVSPQYYNGPGSNYLANGDFETIYDMDSVVTGGNTGTAIGSTTNANCPVTTSQCVAIIGRSQVTVADITANMSTFGAHGQTTYHLTQTQVPAGSGGVAVGVAYSTDAGEATLDVDRVTGTANGAQAVLVYSASGSADGVTTAINYNVNTLVYPVMTISFGLCEANASSSTQTAVETTFQQAAAEGISTFVSSGDAAAAGCDSAFATPPVTTQFKSVNYLCSSPYVTCVGGTEFADASYATYWNSSNGAGQLSAKSYIPEGAWNESPTSPYKVIGSGGGVSTSVTKPYWQIGTGVPADNYRDQPDVAFTAAGHDGYLVYFTVSSGGAQNLQVYSGTSASAPGMAGIAAMLNTRLGAKQGNLNPLIYQLASTTPSAFHDVTVTSSGVGTCVAGTPSMCNNSTPLSSTTLTGGLTGYTVTTGYDQVTGWGSLDVANFFTAAAAAATGVNLSVASAHTGNFKAGDTGDTYTLTVSNAGATTSSGTITVVDTAPSGFTVTNITGVGWACVLNTATCTTTNAIASNASAAVITVTVSVSSANVGLYANTVAASGGGATGTVSAVDETVVVAPPTLAIAFLPASIYVGGTSVLTYTFTNPSTNTVTLTSAGFTNTFPTNLTSVSAPTTTSCTSGSSYSYSYTTAGLTITNGSIAPGGICTYVANVTSAVGNTYSDTTSTITSSNSNAGATANASLTVANQQVFFGIGIGSYAYTDGGTLQNGTALGGTGMAIDANGFAWSINSTGTSLAKFNDVGGSPTTYTPSGLSAAKMLAFDGNNVLWAASSNGKLQPVTNAGAAFSTPIDPAGSTAAPASIAIDTAGSIWISTPTTNTVTEVIGSAGPIATPTVSQVINSNPGTKP